MDKKMNVKKLCRKENIEIMENITVDYISVACSIYHYFFVLDPPLVISDGDSVWP